MATEFDQCLESYKYLFAPDLLRGKVAFITGGASGIGFTIAEIFLRHGCNVAIGSRRLAALQAAASKLEKGTKKSCHFSQMDIRKPEQIEQALDSTLAKYGRIDILVNCAAGNFISPITGLSYNAYRNVMDIDAVGTFITSKLVYQKYFQNHGGVIINISATLHYKGQMFQAHAGSAKAAVDALTKHMAVEWGPSGVRVVGIAPGPIGNTEGMRRLSQGKSEKDVSAGIPLQRFGTKEEIANAALFLGSEAAAYITGDTLVVDGGQWLAVGNMLPSNL